MREPPVPSRPSVPSEGAPARLDELDRDQLAALGEVARLAVEDLELRPMLQRITDALARRFDWELVALVRIRHETGTFVCEALTTELDTEVSVGYGRELGSGVVGQVAASGRPIVLDDVADFPGFEDTALGVASEICVPVRHRGEVVAVLNVESVRPAAFRGLLPFLEGVAAHIGGAVKHSLLLSEARNRADDLTMLAEVSRLAVLEGDLDARLKRLTDYLQDRFDLEIAAVLVSDETGVEWEHRAITTRVELPSTPRGRWPVSDGVVGRAIRTGEPQLVLDVSSDPDYFPLVDAVRAELALPLRFQNRTLGAFNLEASHPSDLSPERVRLFTAVAYQLAGAIELAVLNGRLDESRRALEGTNAELAATNRELERLTRLDGLTGVANRRQLEARLEEEWRRALRSEEPLSFVLFDIDCFKPYNDTYGHPAGDECLRRVAASLAASVERAGEMVARYGGEEFAAVMPRLGREAAVQAAEHAREAVAALGIPHESSTVRPSITVSAGVATVVPTGETRLEDLVSRADDALYRAKSEGRDRVARG